MKRLSEVQDFAELLLSYAELCYAVSLNLTHDRDKARDLTREVLIWAWHRRNRADFPVNVKIQLLKRLRQRYLQAYQPLPEVASEIAVDAAAPHAMRKAINARREHAPSLNQHFSNRAQSPAKAVRP